MKIVYLPLDERPCNAIYPIKAANVANDMEVIAPNESILGKKKVPGNVEELGNFILNESITADAVVLSAEMLAFGGLLPSRLHDSNNELMINYERILKDLKKKNPSLKIYVSNLIMRTPRYSSNDEEPDYYGEYGEEIFNYGWLKDKKNRQGLSSEESEQLKKLRDVIPSEYLSDYEKRRKFNLQVNQLNISLLEDNVIDFLVIPQDDSAEYGYTAMDQKEIFGLLKEHIASDVMVYPGADEVGFTLLARVYNDLKKRQPKIYPFYSSTYGPFITPLYEDRPINETMKAHVMASGCEIVETAEEADLILAYNTPGKIMQESWDQFSAVQDITYSSFRHLPTFAEKIKSYIKKGYPVILADSAYANGGDGELIRLLDTDKSLEKIASYKGWNTNGNTLGSTIAAGVFTLDSKNNEMIQKNLLENLLEDFLYQSIVRMDTTNTELPNFGLNYFDLGEQADAIETIVEHKLNKEKEKYIQNSFNDKNVKVKISFPWNRMFEVNCSVQIN